jgi:hypothetical protein
MGHKDFSFLKALGGAGPGFFSLARPLQETQTAGGLPKEALRNEARESKLLSFFSSAAIIIKLLKKEDRLTTFWNKEVRQVEVKYLLVPII